MENVRQFRDVAKKGPEGINQERLKVLKTNYIAPETHSLKFTQSVSTGGYSGVAHDCPDLQDRCGSYYDNR